MCKSYTPSNSQNQTFWAPTASLEEIHIEEILAQLKLIIKDRHIRWKKKY